MSPVAAKIDIFLKQLLVDHPPSGKVVLYIPAINLAIDAAVTAGEIAVATEGAALISHLPKALAFSGPVLTALAESTV